MSLSCPICSGSITPSLFDYVPTRGTFKQYRCVHCQNWLTINGKARFVLIFIGVLCTLLFAVIVGSAVNALHVSQAFVLLSSIAYGVVLNAGLAMLMRRIAIWVPLPY